MKSPLSPLFQECAFWLDIGDTAAGGQFVLGQEWIGTSKSVIGLPIIAELFPEIVNSKLDKDDNLPSCGTVEAFQRHEPFINQTLAYHALAMLARLFQHRKIVSHGGFINLESGRKAPLTVHPSGAKVIRRPFKLILSGRLV